MDFGFVSVEWKQISAAMQQRLDELRGKLENQKLSEIETAVVRGQILEIRNWLAKPELERQAARAKAAMSSESVYD